MMIKSRLVITPFKLSPFRILRDSLEKLKGECHWLCAVSWQLCGQCKLCPGKVDPETRKCFWHQERECLHDDCAHYVPVDSSPFCCKDAKGPDLRIPQTWIQVSGPMLSERAWVWVMVSMWQIRGIRLLPVSISGTVTSRSSVQ